jgi:UDPglucose 6-dehydrogenase
MTHLGINSAVAAAVKGFKIVCFDKDQKLILSLASGQLSIVEPQLDNLLDKVKENIIFTSEIKDLNKCDIVYISPDITTDNMGSSDITEVNCLLEIVLPSLRSDATLVILSQVSPGFTRNVGRNAGLLFYQVETLIFGRAMERALHPERYIIGCADPEEPLPAPYVEFLNSFDCPLLQMRYESAELAKISINMCLVASVSVANTMAEICENIGADWSEIVPALKMDKRIGEYSYINAGLGVSGGNLERDLTSVIELSKKYGTDCQVPKAWIANSIYRKNWAYYNLLKLDAFDQASTRIAVLGLAYKENTDSIKNSPSLVLLDSLQNIEVIVYDPAVSAKSLGLKVKDANSALDAINGADVLAIMTPWPEFSELSVKKIFETMRGKIVIDPYRILNMSEAIELGLRYKTLGTSDSWQVN